ncbi:DUF3592 domain-containing protein [Breznakiellaceae bacterium SP9]
MKAFFWGGFVFFVFGLGTGIGCFHFIRQNAEMKTYITTEGTVLSATMTNYTTTETSGSRRTHTYYEPLMEYTYTVDGRNYTNDSILIGGANPASRDSGEIEKMYKMIVDHPIGGPITVFYNPNKPAESFVEKSSIPFTYAVVCAVFTILFGVPGILVMVIELKQRRNRRGR